MMRLSLLSVLALIGAALAQDPPPAAKPPDQEHADRLKTVHAGIANEHTGVGDWLASVAQHGWGRIEYTNAVKYEPNHERANKGLGFTIWNEDEKRWEVDPNSPVKVGNEKRGEDADRLWIEYQKRSTELGKKVARLWYDLGTWSEKNFASDKEKSRAAFRKALEYDPTHSEARKKLGHTKQKEGGWLSPEEIATRKEMKDGIAKASGGKTEATPMDAETKLNLKFKKQSSEHFIIGSPHLDPKELENLIKHTEHAYAMFHKIYNQSNLYATQRQELIMLTTKEQHEKYVDAFAGQAGEEYIKMAKDSTGMGDERWQREDEKSRKPTNEDWAIHHAVMLMSRSLARGDRHWLHEGLAYHFTKQMKGSASSHCTNMRGTGAGGDSGKTYDDATTWHIIIKDWLKTGKDPDVYKVFKCTNLAEFRGGDPLKAWSLCEFLTTEYREKFIEFMQKISSAKREEDERVFEGVFGWTLQELDSRWKIYARALYLDGK